MNKNGRKRTETGGNKWKRAKTGGNRWKQVEPGINGWKWEKAGENRWEFLLTGWNWRKQKETNRNRRKRAETVKNGQKWVEPGANERKWAETGGNGRKPIYQSTNPSNHLIPKSPNPVSSNPPIPPLPLQSYLGQIQSKLGPNPVQSSPVRYLQTNLLSILFVWTPVYTSTYVTSLLTHWWT